MPDYPAASATPLLISSWSAYTAAVEAFRNGVGNFAGASFTWPAANRAIYIPFILPWPYLVNRVFWGNGSGTGANTDFGIYSAGGTRIYSTTSTAQSGTSALQYVTPSTTFVLSPGRYYMAVAYSGTTNVAYGSTNGNTSITQREGGCYQQATALPLPATATFAAFASNAYPLIGITRTATGF